MLPISSSSDRAAHAVEAEKIKARGLPEQEEKTALEDFDALWNSREPDRKKRYVEKGLIEALEALPDIGLPAIIRPSFTLGGTGGGIAYNKAEFIEIVERGLDASPTTEVLIEESVLGWKEFEMEVVRDTQATTASSSARSRTSIRWACIPAIRSPSRRR